MCTKMGYGTVHVAGEAEIFLIITAPLASMCAQPCSLNSLVKINHNITVIGPFQQHALTLKHNSVKVCHKPKPNRREQYLYAPKLNEYRQQKRSRILKLSNKIIFFSIEISRMIQLQLDDDICLIIADKHTYIHTQIQTYGLNTEPAFEKGECLHVCVRLLLFHAATSYY